MTSNAETNRKRYRRWVLLLLAERDGPSCCRCGLTVDLDAEPNAPDGPSLDHITPLVAGGTHELLNIAIAHQRCNSRHGGAQRADRWKSAHAARWRGRGRPGPGQGSLL